jgi:integrase
MVAFKPPRLTKRGKGWQLCFYSPRGERRRLSAGTDPHLAQRMAVRFTDWLLEGKNPEREIEKSQQRERSRSVTLAEFFPVFLKRHGSLRSKKTQVNYRASFKNISRCPALANAEIGSISKDLVLDYMSARVENDGICPATVNLEATLVKCMLSRASDWGILEVNPLRGMTLFPASPKRDVELTRQQAQALINSLTEPMASMVEFAMYTGFRKENIQSLQVEAIRFHDLTSTGEAELIVKGGRREVFPLAPAAVALLRRVIGRRRDGYVFVNPKTGSRWCGVNGPFDKAVRELGLTACDGSKLRSHDLRHVFATWLHRDGVSLDVLRTLLGHRDRATTDRYTSVDRLEVGKVLALMPSLRENGQRKPGLSRKAAGDS